MNACLVYIYVILSPESNVEMKCIRIVLKSSNIWAEIQVPSRLRQYIVLWRHESFEYGRRGLSEDLARFKFKYDYVDSHDNHLLFHSSRASSAVVSVSAPDVQCSRFSDGVRLIATKTAECAVWLYMLVTTLEGSIVTTLFLVPQSSSLCPAISFFPPFTTGRPNYLVHFFIQV